MDPTQLAGFRGEVITRAIDIETILSAIITQHYLKRVSLAFMFEVLYDELFSAGLKVRIISKISPLAQQEQALRRLFSIRNVFAHVGLTVTELKAPDKPYTPDTRKPGKTVDFEALYAEFKSLEAQLVEPLNDAMKAAGISMEAVQNATG